MKACLIAAVLVLLANGSPASGEAVEVAPSSFEAFVNQAGVVFDSEEIGSLSSHAATVVVSLIEARNSETDRSRTGVRVDLMDSSHQDSVFIGREELPSVIAMTSEIEGSIDAWRATTADARNSNCLGSRESWMRMADDPPVHRLWVDYCYAHDWWGLSVSTRSDYEGHKFRVLSRRPSDLSGLLERGLE